MVATANNMLVVFAPHALLYGLSAVLYGLLQSYHRFAAIHWPGFSNLVLISCYLVSCYLAFASLNKGRSLAELPLTAELPLSVGTALGIAVLVLVVVPPRWRLHLRFRTCTAVPAGGGAPGGRPGWRSSDSARSSPSSWPSSWPKGVGRPARSSCSTTPRRYSPPYTRSWPCPGHQRVPRPVRA